MYRIADLHCHILPYVDDGAEDMEVALLLLQEAARQGVQVMCLTPHLRQGMFETPDEVICQRLRRLRDARSEAQLPIKLLLSREYHYDPLFCEKLESGEVIPIGEGSFVLVEFSYHHTFAQIQAGIQNVIAHGYTPLIAHVERYGVIRREPGLVEALRSDGAYIQVNAGSILGREGWRSRRVSHALLEREWVDIVASDTHDLNARRPEMEKCAGFLSRRFGEDVEKRLLWRNPLRICKDRMGKESDGTETEKNGR